MNKKCDIVIAGVGGQGIILVANIIGEACIYENLPVKGTETHGMAQRGGSVESHIRIGGLYSPKVITGKADILLALEPLEGARNLHYLKKEGFAIVNTSPIPILNSSLYPEIEKLLKEIKKITPNLIADDFTKMSLKIGSIKVLNVLMLGVCANIMPLKYESFKTAIKNIVKQEFLKINLKAFEFGYNYYYK